MATMELEKSKQAQMVTLENKIEKLSIDVKDLERRKELLQATIDAKTNDYQAYIGSREKSLRDNQAKLAEDQKVLEIQREEFKGTLNAHLADKTNLAKERSDFDREKAKFEGKQRSVSEFVQAVRRAYNVLPE